EEILRVIDEALGRKAAEPASVVAPVFDREHLRLMTDKLAQKVDELKATNERLNAMTDINLRLASERDPHRLLDHVCHAARDLAGARYGLLCVKSKVNGHKTYFSSSGFDPERA